MKRFFYLSIAASLTLLTTACEKTEILETCTDHCTTITGRLVTADGKVPLAGANVRVKWIHNDGTGYDKPRTKAAVTTDANGQYRLNFYIKDDELTQGYFNVIHGVNQEKYYVIDESVFAFHELTRDTIIQIADCVIPRKAYVRLSLTNPTQLSADNAYFASSFSSLYGPVRDFTAPIQGGGPVFEWRAGSAPQTVPVAGDQLLIVNHIRARGSVSLRSTDSLVIPAGTTRDYPVTY